MATGMPEEKFFVLNWTIENFSCWNGEVHDLAIRTREFFYSGCRHTLELYPRGFGQGGSPYMSVRLREQDCYETIYTRYIFSGDLSFIASDGSVLSKHDITAEVDQLVLCLFGPRFKQVVTQIRKNETEHQDRLTLRLRISTCDGSVQYMRTIIDACDASIEISPDGFKNLQPDTFCSLAQVQFPFDDDTIGSLSFQAEKCKYFAIVRSFDSNPTLVLTRTSVVNSRNHVVRTDEREHLFHKMRRWEFPHTLTEKEMEKGGLSLLLQVKIVPSNELKHQCWFSFIRKIGIKVTSTHLINKDSLVASVAESSVDDSDAVSISNQPDDSDAVSISNQPDDSSTSNQVDNSVKELTKDFMCLYQDQDYSDIELNCGDVSFPSHRAILSARSPVFKTMLSSDMIEAVSGKVDIEDMDAPTLSHFLAFLYTGTVQDMQGESALKLFYVADKYQVPSLKMVSSDILCDNITTSNACDILSLADQHQDRNLTSAAHNFILENYNEVLASEEWKSFMRSEPLLALETVTYFGEKNLVVKMPCTS